jgi:hypothetical protein
MTYYSPDTFTLVQLLHELDYFPTYSSRSPCKVPFALSRPPNPRGRSLNSNVLACVRVGVCTCVRRASRKVGKSLGGAQSPLYSRTPHFSRPVSLRGRVVDEQQKATTTWT